MFVADFFQPVHGLAIEAFLDGDVRHGGGGSGAVPMFFARRKPDDVAGANLFDQPAPALGASATGGILNFTNPTSGDQRFYRVRRW